MKNESIAIEVLNDLILINNDRITGYEKAAHRAGTIDPEIKNIFHHMASESRKYVTDLTECVLKLGGQPSNGKSFSGSLYRVWADRKTSFSGTDSDALLLSCQQGEAAAQDAYREALVAESRLDRQAEALVRRQQVALLSSQALLRRYKDLGSFQTR